jgi:predicted HAD superfamily Cof-like phosphohydrolase
MDEAKEDIVDEAERRLDCGAVYPCRAAPGEQDDFGDVATLVERLVAEVKQLRAGWTAQCGYCESHVSAGGYCSACGSPLHVGDGKPHPCPKPHPTYRASIRDQVSEFHRAFGQAIGDKPAVPDEKTVRLRASLIGEEFCEMLAAMFDIDETVIHQRVKDVVELAKVRVLLPELADAWGDIDYVVEGSRLAFGVDGAPIAAEIQRSNLSKLGADGKPVRRADGKVLKGPNFTPPDIAACLKAQGWSG